MKLVIFAFLTVSLAAQPAYDLLIKGGHVVDAKNNVNRVMDVAVANGRIAAVASNIDAATAKRVVQASGLYVTPGLIDMHAHVYAGTGLKALTGDLSVYPDPIAFRSGVTTMVDAGTSGWRNFPDFRERVIDRAKTRVLAFLNIGAVGMAPKGENSPSDMDPDEAIRMTEANKEIIVGFKVAHFAHGGWLDIDNAEKAGKATKRPVMVDFGSTDADRNISTLLLDKLRPGDIYTHCYSGRRLEVLPGGKWNPVMQEGRKRGIIFDVGHGGGSFYWPVVLPAIQQKFLPDTISTDLHMGSINSGMKDMLNVMSKMLVLGMTVDDVIKRSTWNPAQEIQRPELGNLDVGAEADITVLRVEKGQFGFLDSAGARYPGTQRFVAELTVRKGVVMWDLNGIAAPDWKSHDYGKTLKVFAK
ncbi:amidohydrolase/deacetylase family metallohydrolase [uncultured Paludibaculum sp.]|uniref:amidohydrolase/deacetylase family metallohydrolase n=1 Tax=uncultured Paludibaculum sp. TaxID=1765020 RepID=UPI002AABDFF9|nr:amidohydrolase/deacetylase family metallohydrolase [uncultured Paludibaculum sp.]